MRHHFPTDLTDDLAGASELAASDRHDLLRSERRRLTLDVLAGTADTVELGELAAGIVAREEGLDAVGERGVERVAISLHHVHLPKLAEFGVVDYDPERRQVAPADDPGDDARTVPADR